MLDGWVIWVVLVLGMAWLWPRWRRMRAQASRILREDALKHIHKAHVNGRHPTLQSLAGTLHLPMDRAATLLSELEAHGLVLWSAGDLQLTPAGQEAALHVIRAHRLWESYLAERTGLAEAQWHAEAEDREHHLSPVEVDALAAQLGHPTHDPHGDAIPAAGESLPADRGEPLARLAPGQAALITHIEDEPPSMYAQIIAMGLRPGLKLRVLDRTPTGLRLWADGDEHVLAHLLAHNITVLPIPDFAMEEPESLAELAPGEKGKVLGISRACRGAERRRLLDLGFVPGTDVTVEMNSPLGDPTAYRMRETVIALRPEQASLISVQPVVEEGKDGR